MMAAIIVVATLSATAAAFVRLLRGPSQADRVIAIEVMFSSAVMLAAAAGWRVGAITMVLFLTLPVSSHMLARAAARELVGSDALGTAPDANIASVPGQGFD